MTLQLIRVMSLVRDITLMHIALSNTVIVILFQMFFRSFIFFFYLYYFRTLLFYL